LGVSYCGKTICVHFILHLNKLLRLLELLKLLILLMC